MKHRIFIGIFVDDKLKENILFWQNDFKSELEICWVKPENLHLTIVPPFNVFDEELDKVIYKFNTVKLAGSFFIDANFLGFGNTSFSNKLILLSLLKTEDLAETKRIFDELFKIKEKREYRPHITIGKIQGNHSEIYQENVDWGMKATKVSLIESTQTADGPEYMEIANIQL